MTREKQTAMLTIALGCYSDQELTKAIDDFFWSRQSKIDFIINEDILVDWFHDSFMKSPEDYPDIEKALIETNHLPKPEVTEKYPPENITLFDK